MADFGSISSTTYASRTNTTITAPTGITDGDLLLLLFVTGAGGEAPDSTPPAGFALVPGAWPIELLDAGFNLECRVYYKIASGESGNYTVTHLSCSSQGVIVRITGVDTASPFQPNPTLNSGTTANSTFTGLTTVVDATLIVLCHWDWASTTNNLTPPTGTTPTFTERLDTVLTYVATGVLATAGSTGNKTMANNSGTNEPWAAVMVAIAPAAGGDAAVVVGTGSATAAGTSAATQASSAVATGSGSAAAAGVAAAARASSTAVAGSGSASAAGTAAAPVTADVVAVPVGTGAATVAGTAAAAEASSTAVVGTGAAAASGTAVTPVPVDAGDATVVVGTGSATAEGSAVTPVVEDAPEPVPEPEPSTGGGRYEPGGDESSIYGESVRVKVGPASAVASGTQAIPRAVDGLAPWRIPPPRRRPVPEPTIPQPEPVRVRDVRVAVGAAVAVAVGAAAVPELMVKMSEARAMAEDAEMLAVALLLSDE